MSERPVLELLRDGRVDGKRTVRFNCPGCRPIRHHFSIGPGGWGFNGDFVRPTVSPSILVTGGWPPIRCHSLIRDGQIEFLADCHHGLAGQTVPLPPIDAEGYE